MFWSLGDTLLFKKPSLVAKTKAKWEDISAFNGSCAMKPLKMTQERHSGRYAWKKGQGPAQRRACSRWRFITLYVFNKHTLLLCHVEAIPIQKWSQRDFPSGPPVKNPPGRFSWWQVDRNPATSTGDTGLVPGPGRSHVPRSSEARAPHASRNYWSPHT